MLSKLAMIFITALAGTASARSCKKCTATCKYSDGMQPCGNECVPRGAAPTTTCDDQGQKPNCACFGQSDEEKNHWTCCRWCTHKSEASGDGCVKRGHGSGDEGCACNLRDYSDA